MKQQSTLEPENWWEEILRYHGHVGPWNILGFRAGKLALDRLGVSWGSHLLHIELRIPRKTPYSCMADGLTVATGNSLGRLDIEIHEIESMKNIKIVFYKDRGTDNQRVLEVCPSQSLMEFIDLPTDDLEGLARDTMEKADDDIFDEVRLSGVDRG